MGKRTRVVAHLDLDCFYVQVELRRRPELKGKPVCVVQYNSWKGGGMIAVSYESRAFGIKRSMRGDQARRLCPSVELITVPVKHGKSDMQIYRDAGGEVISAIEGRVERIERASIDEAYIDITAQAERRLATASDGDLRAALQESHIVGVSRDPAPSSLVLAPTNPSPAEHPAAALPFNAPVEGARASEGAAMDKSRRTLSDLGDLLMGAEDRLLAAGALVVRDIRNHVLAKTGFTMSAGVGHNKMLAKLVSGMNKPFAQTLIHTSAVEAFFADLPIEKVKGLGAKFGDRVKRSLDAKTMGQLRHVSDATLRAQFGDRWQWLHQIARGLDDTPVAERSHAKSIGCSKTFFRTPLQTRSKIRFWMGELAKEVAARVKLDHEVRRRLPRNLVIDVSFDPSSKKKSGADPMRPGATLVERWNGRLSANRKTRSVAFRRGVTQVSADACAVALRVLEQDQGARASFTPVIGLGLSAGNFSDPETASADIKTFFSARAGSGSGQADSKDEANGRYQMWKPLGTAGMKRERTTPNPPKLPPIKRFLASAAAKSATRQRRAGVDPEAVDWAVVAELPPDIRDEIQKACAQRKRQKKKANKGILAFLEPSARGASSSDKS